MLPSAVLMPTWGELLIGPFTGLSIYPRAAGLRPRVLVLVLLLVLGSLGGVLAGVFQARLSGQVDELRNSALWLMPRVNIADGVARVESAPGRTLDAGLFVLVLDTSVNRLEELPGERDDTRAVVHVTRQALVVYKRDRRVATGYPWSGVESSLGPLSLDGPELIDFLGEYASRLTWFLWAVGFTVVALWQLLLIFGFVGLYRTLFYRGLYVPRFGALVSVACVASLPGVVLAAVLLLAGLAQPTVAAVHALTFGALFFVAATRVRLGDERPDLTPIAPAGAPPEPGTPIELATPIDDPK